MCNNDLIQLSLEVKVLQGSMKLYHVGYCQHGLTTVIIFSLSLISKLNLKHVSLSLSFSLSLSLSL